jgi:LPXTG-motif cell wall-anchored protein
MHQISLHLQEGIGLAEADYDEIAFHNRQWVERRTVMQSKVARTTLAALFLASSAALVLAQLSGGYSNAPTSADYRITVIEPTEGAKIQGPDVTIELRLPRVPEGSGISQTERRDTLTPTFQVFVDGRSVGNLPQGQNVFTARGLSEGPHKIAIVAKNTAGEVLDRKDVNITTAAVTSQAAAVAAPAPPPPPQAVAPEPPAPVAAPPPAPPAPAPSAPTSLPKTGTSLPAVALAGLAMLLAGALLRRF